jgi:hypothetical protein
MRSAAGLQLLGLPGAWVTGVEFGAQGMIVTVALRRRRPPCSGCGAQSLKLKDNRVKPWRHLEKAPDNRHERRE